MAANTIISIKRSQDSAEPLSLANGELAYSFSSDKLFIGQTSNSSVATTVEYIGGKLLVDKVANLESLVLSGSGTINTSNLVVTGDATIDRIIFSTYSNNAVLITKADGVVDFLTGTDGKVLQIAANGTPVFDDLNGGTF
jgi:hypothetical protein